MKGTIGIIILVLLSAAVDAQPVIDTVSNKDTMPHLSKIGFAISGNFGAGIASANAGNPDMDRLNYSNVSNQRMPNATYSSSGGINIGLDLDLIFGKQRNIELSAGLIYIYTKGTADFSGYHAEYEAQDGNGNTFRRLLTATRASESLSYGNVSIPVLFKYSTNPDKKMGAYVQIGPVLSLSASASGTMNSTSDFEAVYHYSATTKSFVYSPATAPGDWILTRQALSAELPAGQSVNNYFSQLYARGYDVALGEIASGKINKVSYHIGGGMMARLDGEYRASNMLHVLFGITAVLLSNGHTVSSYAPITASNDLSAISQSNFLNGTSSLLTMQIGVHLGVQVRLLK